ncbi:MAG: HD domain-containing protein [Bacteroides sp.]|nr:HD domain-containing protein [Roseburia sp.]MCM1345637.1 HD domain-containing protein [Bacteroides sp.]MCM1420941.1 HD domain-containing protein [Bacteroides sp.]
MEVSKHIKEYVERMIIPRYAHFDKAHREDHVRMVIERSLQLAMKMLHLNCDMVYIASAFHDLGLTNGREKHHYYSRTILENDNFVREHFTDEEIRLMGEAVEDHRASNKSKPRNDYGLVVAEADRLINPETIVRRTVQYGLSNSPDFDREEQYQRAKEHLSNKYGRNGYLKIWIPWSDNAAHLERLHELIENEKQLRAIFDRIFAEET